MGFFANAGAQNEGEIVLSADRHHLYRVVKGKFIEIKKILTPPGNPKLWEPGQKRGVSIFDVPKRVAYVYNIDEDIWISVYDYDFSIRPDYVISHITYDPTMYSTT